MDDQRTTAEYKRARGKGGFVRSTWDEVVELIAAAQVHTIKRNGPDRIVGFSPIPAMSMTSYAAGTRFLSLIGATISSFYDWYADLPVASPQVFADQTDVPESADWFNAAYLIVSASPGSHNPGPAKSPRPRPAAPPRDGDRPPRRCGTTARPLRQRT